MRLDDLIRRGAAAGQRCVGGKPAKVWSVAHEVHVTRGRRHLNGDPHSPLTKMMTEVDRVARAPKLNAWPLITEAIGVVRKAEIEIAPTEVLLATLEDLNRREHRHDGVEDESSWDAEKEGTHLAAAQADAEEADIHLERMAIRYELAKRAGELSGCES